MTFASTRFASVVTLSLAVVACSSEAPSTAASSENDIIGGVDATSAALDAIGTVGHLREGGFDYFCTATLIAPRVVLTAKHCAAEGPKGATYLSEEPIYFAVGADSLHPKKTVKASEVFLSPVEEGGFVKYGADVALYLLEEPITDVTPLPYVRGHLAESEVGKKLTAVGFGVHDRQRESGTRKAGAVTLQAVSGQPLHKLFATFEDLRAFVGKVEADWWMESNEDRLASFYDLTLLADHEAYVGLGKDDAQPCSGDSGGPLVQRIDGKNVVVAVVSGSFKGSTYPCSVLGEAYATLGPKVQPLIASVTGPCEGITVEGRCEGTTAARCVSDQEGPVKLTRIDCAAIGQVCGRGPTGQVACVDEGAGGAGQGGSSHGGAGGASQGGAGQGGAG
jgi:secreted trypsin-like serine protease